MDATDIRILSALQQRGSLSKTKLAELVNLSPTPCWSRIDKLKKAGLIRGYHADIALELIAELTRVIVTLSLANHRKSDFDWFEHYIHDLDEVIECIATGGGTDYIMKVVTPNLASFQTMMDTQLSAELGIDHYMIYIVTRDVNSSQPNLSKIILNKDS